MTLEDTPIGLATLDDLFQWFRVRRYGEPVMIVRINSEEMVVSEECDPDLIKKMGRSLIRYAKEMGAE